MNGDAAYAFCKRVRPSRPASIRALWPRGSARARGVLVPGGSVKRAGSALFLAPGLHPHAISCASSVVWGSRRSTTPSCLHNSLEPFGPAPPTMVDPGAQQRSRTCSPGSPSRSTGPPEKRSDRRASKEIRIPGPQREEIALFHQSSGNPVFSRPPLTDSRRAHADRRRSGSCVEIRGKNNSDSRPIQR